MFDALGNRTSEHIRTAYSRNTPAEVDLRNTQEVDGIRWQGRSQWWSLYFDLQAMKDRKFDNQAIKIGAFSAIVALPFAIGLGSICLRSSTFVGLFSGSEWFAFKAVVGATEIAVFGVAAAISQSRRPPS